MIVGVTGHQQLPLGAVPLIAEQILNMLRHSGDALTGVTSLAAGADQIFAEAVLAVSGKLHVVVPSAGYETAFADAAARSSYFELLNRADVVETLPHAQPSSVAFFDAGRRVADLSELLIAVWDGEMPRGTGGTADVVQYARARGSQIVILWPAGLTR